MEKEDRGAIKFSALVLVPVAEYKYERLGALAFDLPAGQEFSFPMANLTHLVRIGSILLIDLSVDTNQKST